MFTDYELYSASRIAYFIFDDTLVNDIKSKRIIALSSAVKNYGNKLNKGTSEEIILATEEYYQKVADNIYYSDWQILRVDPFYNEINGCYAITLLPPGSDTAIIAFRGSEGGDQFTYDWIIADFGLYAGEITAQQSTAYNVVDSILKDESLKDYNFVLTGHSLGGNLAAHCAINTMNSRILSCTSFDGPNFADGYVAAHSDEISLNAHKITHYQWSIVGAIFKDVEGSSNYSIKVRDDLFFNHFTKHNLMDNKCVESVEFDDNGNVIETSMYALEEFVKILTVALDDVIVGHMALDLFFTTLNENPQLFDKDIAAFISLYNKRFMELPGVPLDTFSRYALMSIDFFKDKFGSNMTLAEMFNDKIIKGNDGDDTLIGTNENNIFKVTGGTDTIITGEGINTCVIEADTYNTTIYAQESTDGTDATTIIFSDDTTMDNVAFSVDWEHSALIITRKDVEGKTIKVMGITHKPENYDIIFLFSDGTRVFTKTGAEEFRTLYGTENGDELSAVIYGSTIYGNDGSDNIIGSGGADTLYGGVGIDTIHGEDGDDNIYGEDNSDKIYGGLGNDTIYGGIGDDLIHCDMADDGANGGNDIVHGDDGEDTIYGESGADTIYGGYGDDMIYGGDGDDLIHCDVESDQGDGGDDIAYGGNGADQIYGEYGADKLYGDADNDFLYGQNDDDELYGNSGDDELNGGNGNDILVGGADNDMLKGLSGNDKYMFVSESSGSDTIDDGYGENHIVLPETIAEDTVRAYIGNKNSILIKYGNSELTIVDFFSDEHSRNFTYSFGTDENAEKMEMGSGSFAYKLYDKKFDVPLDKIIGIKPDMDYSYVDAYKEFADRLGEEVYNAYNDPDYELTIDLDDLDIAMGIDEDIEAVAEIYAFITDPKNQPYIAEAFSGADPDEIAAKVKTELDYLKDTEKSLDNIIPSFLAYLNDNGMLDIEEISTSVDSMKDAYDQYVAAQNVPPLDPLIIDIAGDGFSFTSADEGVNFDMNNDGFAEKTGWTNGNDALLVLDRDGDGSITNGGELFGDQTTLADGTLASSGFVALAEFDENADGRIDSSDTVFSELNVWQDADHNGISAADELSSLTDMGIEAISLLPTAVDNTDAETGAYFASIANVVMSDGSDCNIGEFKFQSNLYDTNDLVVAEISEEISALPNVRSFGSVLSLHKAMALDEDGSIREKISAFCEETDVAQADALLEEVLFELCDATDIAPDSRGRYIDARKLAVVERMLGSDFAGVNGSDPNSAAAPMLIDAYNTIFSTYYSTLAAQSTIDIYLKMGQLSVEDGSVSVNVGAVASYLGRQYDDGTDVSREAVDIGRYFRYLDTSYDTAYFVDYYLSCENISGDLQTLVAEGLIAAQMGTDNGEYIVGNNFDNVVFGNGGNDSLSMQGGVDIMFGGSDDDTIDGHGGNDHIIGGIGNDSLRGGDGADTYHFAQGFGNDVIYDSESYSTIRFYDGITLEDIYAVSPNRYDIVIGVNGTDDTITLPRFMWYETHRDFYLEFADGEKIHCLDENSPLNAVFGDDGDNNIEGNGSYSIIYGLGGKDWLEGTAGNDFLYGGDGNDTIEGGDGSDVLDGGADTDILRGNAGNDTYVFAKGYGVDSISDNVGTSTIKFIDEISPDELKVSYHDTTSIKISVDGTEDALILMGYRSSEDCRNIVMEFDDGTVLSGEDNYIIRTIHGTDANNVINAVDSNSTVYGYAGNDSLSGKAGDDVLYGGDGDDRLDGYDGNDILDGGAGTDRLYGENDDDIYVFGIGYGIDTIYDDIGTSTIRFMDGIEPDDLIFTPDSGYSYKLTVSGTEDALILNSYRSSASYQNYVMEFADGTVLSGEDNYIVRNIHGTESNDSITAIHNTSTIFGCAGDDTLRGSETDDVLYGGDGVDTLYGNGGNDTLDGGAENDSLQGGVGDDEYVFCIGHGVDKIVDKDGTNIIRFADDILPEDLKASYTGTYDIQLSIQGTDDALILNNYRHSELYQNYMMEFADGTLLTADNNHIVREIHGTDANNSISAALDNVTLYGYAGDDTLRGTSTNDVIYGGDGVDTLYGNGGNDTLDGGTANDNLQGGAGDDTYIFGIGYGVDTISDSDGTSTIRFVGDITADDITLTCTNNNLSVSINGTEDSLTLLYFGKSESYRAFALEFEDGSSYSIDPSTYTLVQNEVIDYAAAAEVVTEMQSFDAAPSSSDSSSCLIYPNVALINDILSVADSDVYGNVSENRLQYTDSTNMLFEQYYVR